MVCFKSDLQQNRKGSCYYSKCRSTVIYSYALCRKERDWEEEANTTASSSQSHFHIRHKRSRFIKATSTDNEHVRIVSAEQCHYKSGDTVKVIGGEFEGVIGKVARVAGQQRVVVEISGLCLVATAYIPTIFIESFK